LSVRYQQLPYW